MSEADYNQVAEVRGVLIPFGNGNLLLPNAVVAEVIDYRDPEYRAGDDAPPWLRGIVNWRQHKLPLVAFESLMGDAFELPRRARIAVCNALDPDAKHPFVGIITGGIPRLVRVSEDSLEPVPSEGQDGEHAVLARAKVNEADALIPDLDKLGWFLGEAL